MSFLWWERVSRPWSCCVLLYFSTQGEIAHTPTFDASSAVEDQIDPVPPPVVSRTNQNQDRRSVISTRVRKNFSDSRDMVLTLPPAKFISWSHTIKTALGMPRVQHNCLTTAVYFEARSEPLLGQLAVATVILNRVKSSNSSICGVVYKGASPFQCLPVLLCLRR